jgi:hypothetical protein
MRHKMITVCALTLALGACTQSDDAYFLAHAQILALRSEPSHVPPGGTVRVDALVGDEAGDVSVVVPDQLAASIPAQKQADGWYVTAPAGSALDVEVTATVTVDDEALVGTKALVFADAQDNPTIDQMYLDGSAAAAIAVAKGATPTLALANPDASALSYAWYTSLGELEQFRSAQATFDATEAGDGVVCVVVRDGQGGVAWQVIDAHVE